MPAKPHKFVLLADIHIGNAQQSEPCTRVPERARSLLRYVVSRTNSEIRPDFVVQLGDLIEAEDTETDEEHLSSAVEVLTELRAPLYHVVGNHEQANLKLARVASVLKYPKLHYSFHSGPFFFVVIVAKIDGDRAAVDDSQLAWLEQELGAAEKPTIVFSHFSLHDDEVEDESQPPPPIELSKENRAAIRNVLALSGKVRAVFSAHVHKNDLHEIGGIHYVSVQSLVQNTSETRKAPSESFALVKLYESETTVEVEGLDPAEFRF